jgi:ankyrin repeat protein
VDCLQLLLDYGADPQWLTEERNTTLHEACARSNKRAIKMLIFHGADMAIENVGYHKCFQMVQGDANRLAMQNFLNTSLDQFKEALVNKDIIPCPRQQRSYVRGIFDVLDEKGRGSIRFQDAFPFLQTMFNNEETTPNSEAALSWFATFDKNQNGLVPYDEFLYACLLQFADSSKGGKKGGGKKSKKKK